VAGAVIALQDGLLVASCLPPTWRADLLTAFLPQIFARLGQYCQELQLGPLREVSLTVQAGTLQVFQAGLVFFAVLGEPGALPWPRLRLIAGELSRHTK
jgi:predicted regulator of Ras-like GTPase activity (Roadblock/LC7/MglB family)